MRLLVLLLVACSSPKEHKPEIWLPRCTTPQPASAGEGTHYDFDGKGKCGLEAPADRLIAAMNSADYAKASWCGACLVVTGPDGEIVVRVVDKCPRCKHGDLDLSREAFELIAPLSAGRIPITWLPVPCEVQGPIEYQFKAGSNPFWTAIQLRNHRYPIATLETRDSTGGYRELARADYNYFVAPKGLGRGPYTLRVTDTRGHTLEDGNVIAGEAAQTGSASSPAIQQGVAQFPLCP